MLYPISPQVINACDVSSHSILGSRQYVQGAPARVGCGGVLGCPIVVGFVILWYRLCSTSFAPPGLCIFYSKIGLSISIGFESVPSSRVPLRCTLVIHSLVRRQPTTWMLFGEGRPGVMLRPCVNRALASPVSCVNPAPNYSTITPLPLTPIACHPAS